MFRVAYHLPGVGIMHALDSPAAKRLFRGLPNIPGDPENSWMAQQGDQGGSLLVWPQLDGATVGMDKFGPGRETFDGLTYYPSLDAQPEPEDLIRPERERPQGIWVNAQRGALYIALAAESPRELIMRVGKPLIYGRYANEYGLLGHELYDVFTSKEGILESDPRLARLLFLAEQASYYRTEEMAEDRSWLTSADVNPVVHAIMGIDPKALEVGPSGSASSDQTTETLP